MEESRGGGIDSERGNQKGKGGAGSDGRDPAVRIDMDLETGLGRLMDKGGLILEEE